MKIVSTFFVLLLCLLLEVFFAQFPFVLVASLYFGWRNPRILVFVLILLFSVVLDVLRVSPLGLSSLITFCSLFVLFLFDLFFASSSRVAWVVVSLIGVFSYLQVVEYLANPLLFVLVFGIVAVAVFYNRRPPVDDSLAFYKVWR